MRKVNGFGPEQADIVFVGEAPGEDEELEGKPFVGSSGKELMRMLREAGIDPRKCYFTNVCKYRPPGNKIETWLTDKKKTGIANEWEMKDGRYYSEEIGEGLRELLPDIYSRSPKLVVGLGNVPLWALTGEWGISDWRGSEMQLLGMDESPIPFVPTLHPAGILRNWTTRAFAVHDFKTRIARRIRDGFDTPYWDFNWTPSLQDALGFIGSLTGDVAVDVETSRGRIVCVGLGVSARRAMCIPFISEGYGSYWSALDAQIVLTALEQRLLDPSVHVIGQNFNYDASYFDDNFNFLPRVHFDTLIAQTVLFPSLPRGLGFLSSMYCDWHCYWKDDARDWNNLREFARLFEYNCRDVCATWEIAQVQRKMVERANLTAQLRDRITYNHSVYDMMQEGVIRDTETTKRLDTEIEEALQERKIIICNEAGYPVNPTSPTQVSKLLYAELGCRKPARRGQAAGGTGEEELKQVLAWHPEKATLCRAILEHRSLASMRSTFLAAKLDPDGRLRSSFMATGTETFRLTSSKNNFGRGTNLLNLSGSGTTHSGNKVPNFRCAIVPPIGCTQFETDLERADLQIVVWEADDADLKAKMRAGVDIHYENAKDIYGTANPSDVQREKSKTFVHATDYGACARTAAIQCGQTVHETDLAQKRWFAAHPGIKRWHERTEAQLAASRTVTNRFGYRMIFYDRIAGLLPQALAWIPQSTIAIYASLLHMAFEQIEGVVVQLQVYDSVMGYYPTANEQNVIEHLSEAKKIFIPYDDPLCIPLTLKASTISWGDCEKRAWPI